MNTKPVRMCEFCGKLYYAKGLCVYHYNQKRKGIPLTRRFRYDPNEVFIRDGYAEIAMYDRQLNIRAFTKIDLDDVPKASAGKWYLSSNGYVCFDGGEKCILLHRVITDVPDALEVDHINHDKTDNRKSNLRICSRSQNMQNIRPIKSNTGEMGVTLIKGKYFLAQISRKGVHMYLGLHKTLHDAVLARKDAEAKHNTWGCDEGV